MLERAKVEGTQRPLADVEKARVYVKISQFWIQAEYEEKAETYVKLASHVIEQEDDDDLF